MAAKALGALKDPRAVEPLVAALQDADAGVRSAAAEALGGLQDSRAVEPLIATLQDADTGVRQSAADVLIAHFNGLGFPWVTTALHHYFRSEEKSVNWSGYVFGPGESVISLAQVPAYAGGVLDMFHLNTAKTAYPAQLAALGALWDWSGPRTAVAETALDADLAALRARAGTQAEAVDANPYLALFIARLHQEQGRNEAALTWIERARTRIPTHEIAPQIVLGWIEAQALRQAGRFEPALAVVNRLERELLPRLAGIERKHSGLAFDSQTLALKGILLGDLNQYRPAIEALYAAGDALKREQTRTWIPETAAQRVQVIIDGYHATLLQAEGKAKAQQALDLIQQTPPSSRLEQEAESRALIARLKAALGEGDYELAQQLGERLVLKHQAVPGQLLAADPARQAHYQQLQGFQQQIQQRLREQDAAEQATRQARDQEDRKKKQAELAAAQARRQQTQREFKQFLVQLKNRHPEVAALIGAEPTELRHWQARLQPHQRLIQYLLLDDQGWAFVASADSLEVVNLTVGRVQLRDIVNRYRLRLQTPASVRGLTVHPTGAEPDTLATLGQQLRQHLLEPLRPHLNQVTHLLIIPNGPLHQLPFAALPWDNDQFLVQHFQLSSLSSPSLLVALNTAPPAAPPQLVALGNPLAEGWSPLPASEQEVQTLATLLAPPLHPQPAIYLGEQAQRSRLIGQNLNGKVLHLAVHGQAGTLDTTRLILSDGPLTVSEVWGLALERAPLVVLSACETALGQQLSGDEVVSLANGFLFAGAQAVVSSLWPVPDPPTRALMERFYGQREQGESPAAALAAAQRALIQGRHAPYHWAGFVVAGW